MRDKRRLRRESNPQPGPSSLVPHPSSLILHPSSFILHPSSFILPPSSLILHHLHGLERLKTLPLSLRLVRELHERLLAGVRGGHATPGEFRRTQNWIGPPGATLNQATYVPPPPDALGEQLSAWERFLYDQTLPPLVHAALMHYQFEAIHTVMRAIGHLQAQGVLTSVGRAKRDRAHCATALLDILEEPARLTPM